MSARPVRFGVLAASRLVLAMATAAIVAWLGGLIWFAESIPSPDRTLIADTRTDAVVVLTGGPLRVQTGVDLLVAGHARKLFVSGVNREVELKELLQTVRRPEDFPETSIVLGKSADNTEGNATETRDWMASEGFHSLRLVTASYHLKRSLLEFRRALPGIAIVQHPVFIENFRRDAWWAWPGTLSLITVEYNKFLAALLRPFLPVSPEKPAGAT